MSLSARELHRPHSDFLAQQEAVVIIPHFSMESILLIGGNFGPFKPLKETSVPLWLALVLLRSKVCELKMPHWMTVESLQEALQYEKQSANFYPLPFHATEFCHFMLTECGSSLEGTTVDAVGKLLGEIMILRWTKLLKDLDVFKNTGVLTPGLRISNLTCLEIDKLRPVMLSLLNDGADFKQLMEMYSSSTISAGGSSSPMQSDYLSALSNSAQRQTQEARQEIGTSPLARTRDTESETNFRRRQAL
ncbi:DNA replication complex GINS protein PSF2-like protein [Perkinsela sp. CCAP 1560/4]|nr:DNA replication complex GINS protein PSF2-like protein [Perkinsela sp. CCAP 1560/4]|eukprot:KNH09513.1 DNA replication complex GINS protein PSF2-like protein [Perkinsela sp. CCAP 1560/4]